MVRTFRPLGMLLVAAAVLLVAIACGSGTSSPSAPVPSTPSVTTSAPAPSAPSASAELSLSAEPSASAEPSGAPSPSASSLPSPSGAPSPSASSLPSPSGAPSPSGSAEPTSQATAVAGGEPIVGAFLTDFVAANPPFHVALVVTGRVNVTGDTVGVSGDLDVQGEDAAGTLNIEAGGQSQEADVVIIGDTAYVRPAGGEWQENPTFQQTQPNNPFVKLSEDDLVYLGEDRPETPGLHHLRTNTWIGEDPASLESQGLTDARIDASQFDIYVGEDGIPVDATLTFTLSATLQGQAGTLDYEVLYEFSNVGEPVEIEPPI